MIHTASLGLWIGTIALIILLIVIDLGVFRRGGAHVITLREAALTSSLWVLVSLAFNCLIWFKFGRSEAIDFFTGYIIEYSLSVDNLFVFMLIFSYFNVPATVQHRVLFFGIVGALAMRGFFIAAGAALITRFEWILYIFGLILIFSAYKIAFQKEEQIHPEKNPVYRLFKYLLPMVPDYHGDKFFVKIKDTSKNTFKLCATPLFLVLISVEVTDLIFAVDSIPAIFAITKNSYIVFTSNIFAVLGLRSLFFLLSGTIGKMEYLKIGLAIILAFVGVKMLTEHFYKIPNAASLTFIISVLTISTYASLRHSKKIAAAQKLE